MSTNLINEKLFDAQLITVGDYTIQGKVSGPIYKKFLTVSGDHENSIARFE